MNRKIFAIVIIFSLTSVMLILGAGQSLTSKYKKWFVLGFTNAVDNRYNYANHDYCSDMLKTAELETIFMTRGDDNDVFGLLYFSLINQARPDIDFFDQQGNVFPRLYGDFIGYHPKEIELIRYIRDFQLFSTGRPVYLTWKRKNIHLIHPHGLNLIKTNILNDIQKHIHQSSSLKEKLHWQSLFDKIELHYRVNSLKLIDNTSRTMISSKVFSGKLRSGDNLFNQDYREVGPWYLKPIGLLYRVTPLRYAILDGLIEMGNKGSKEGLLRYLNKKLYLNTKVNKQSFQLLLKKLEEEQHIRILGQSVTLLKPLILGVDPLSSAQGMLDFDYWSHYSFSFLKRKESREWDMLSRQIFAKYFSLQKEMLERTTKQLRNSIAYETNVRTKKNIIRKIRQLNQKAFENEAKKVMFLKDNPQTLIEIAQLYEEKKLLKKAAFIFTLAANTDIHFAWGFLRAAEILLEENQLENLTIEEKRKTFKKILLLLSRHQKRKKMQMFFLKNTAKDHEELSQSREMSAITYQLLEKLDKNHD